MSASHEPYVVTEADVRGDTGVGLPDQIELLSVGIDIGSATSHMSVAEIVLRRMGKALSSRYVVISRRVRYESPILLTPYLDDTSIDAERLDVFIRGCFEEAGLDPEQIDTGAVILTGEALRRRNARAIGELFEDHAGRFVCATAGDLFEVTMAAHGSGAVRLSRELGGRVLNIDVGGGTAKLSVSENGAIVERGVLHVGARLLATDEDGVIERCEEAARTVAAAVGREVRVGEVLDAAGKETLAEAMLDAVTRFMGLQPTDELTRRLAITEPMHIEDVDTVVFSSGIAEYVYDREARDWGDLALPLAAGIKARLGAGTWPWPVHQESTGIRATVSGVSQYSVQMSGDTIAVRGAETLPWRNLRLVNVDATSGDPEKIRAEMLERYRGLDLASREGGMAWYVSVVDDRRYDALRRVADGLHRGLAEIGDDGRPQAVIFEVDVAGSMGHILLDELGLEQRTAILDCIASEDVDFIDIGQVVEPNSVVPVMVKTLVF